MWDANHERPFSCIDPGTPSKLLVVRESKAVVRVSSFIVVFGFGLQTTRIKGIMPKGLEVELELLSVRGTEAQTFPRLIYNSCLVRENRIGGAVGCRS